MVKKKIAEENETKESAVNTKKRNIFILKLSIIGLVVLNIIILSAVFWQRYLEPKFGFDLVAGGQPVAEALSLAPVVNDTPPSTFQGTPEPVSTNQESLLKEIVNALHEQTSEQPVPDFSQIEQKINGIQTTLLNIRAYQMIVGVEQGLITLPELSAFLAQNPSLHFPELQAVLKEFSFERILPFENIYLQAEVINKNEMQGSQDQNFFSKVKTWIKGLVVIEKTGNEEAQGHFLKALKAQNIALSVAFYGKLSPEEREKLKSVYGQLLLRDAIEKTKRSLILKNLSQG